MQEQWLQLKIKIYWVITWSYWRGVVVARGEGWMSTGWFFPGGGTSKYLAKVDPPPAPYPSSSENPVNSPHSPQILPYHWCSFKESSVSTGSFRSFDSPSASFSQNSFWITKLSCVNIDILDTENQYYVTACIKMVKGKDIDIWSLKSSNSTLKGKVLL